MISRNLTHNGERFPDVSTLPASASMQTRRAPRSVTGAQESDSASYLIATNDNKLNFPEYSQNTAVHASSTCYKGRVQPSPVLSLSQQAHNPIAVMELSHLRFISYAMQRDRWYSHELHMHVWLNK
jgi:hypothetical protein